MKFTYALIVCGLVAALPVRAVYAPIPEQDQGKDLTISVSGGISYDSNIFGGATDPISSTVFEFSPQIAYNVSLTDQTFVSASYTLTLDDITNRPGDKLLDSHTLNLRAAHAFTKETVLDLNNTVMLARNPQSLLNGVPLNTDQSFAREQFDGHLTAPLSPKASIDIKARSAYTKYRNSVLGRMLDRVENLYGVAGDYAVLPEVKAVAEYRHQDVYYMKEGVESKNKQSDYVMGGFDYAVAKKLTVSGRLGAEWRRRVHQNDATAPFVEFSGRYDYAEKSFITGGYGYSFDEASDPTRFFDEKVARYFVNVEHALTPLIVASLSADIEPAELQGRPDAGQRNINETARRFGAALTYLLRKNWSISLTYDRDSVSSEDPSRATNRDRYGVTATYTF
jgi:hypothetical protein